VSLSLSMRVTMTVKREVLGFFECREWGLFLWWGAAGFFLLKTGVLSRESTEWGRYLFRPLALPFDAFE
jgi:hypothetical protein